MTRIAVIEAEKCNQTRCGGLLCAKVCPVNRTGKDCVYEGEDKKAKINEELCIGCGICSRRCPVQAIDRVPDAAALHEYLTWGVVPAPSAAIERNAFLSRWS